MSGRIGSLLIAGAAIFGGMVMQGDVDLDFGDKVVIRDGGDGDRADRGERDFDRRVGRIIDRATRGIDSRGDDDRPIEQNPVIRRQMAGTIAEYLRAEASLARAQDDDKLPKAALDQAKQRRDAARVAVDRLADEAKAVSRDDREEIRDGLREEVRDAVRDGVRG